MKALPVSATSPTSDGDATVVELNQRVSEYFAIPRKE